MESSLQQLFLEGNLALKLCNYPLTERLLKGHLKFAFVNPTAPIDAIGEVTTKLCGVKRRKKVELLKKDKAAQGRLICIA